MGKKRVIAAVVLGAAIFGAFSLLPRGGDYTLDIERQGSGEILDSDVVRFRIRYPGQNVAAGAWQIAEVEARSLPPILLDIMRRAGIGGRGRFSVRPGRLFDGAVGSPFSDSEPVPGEFEVFGTIPEEFAKPAYPLKYSIGIFVVDHGGTGEVDILGKSTWRRKAGSWIDQRDSRLIKMDGTYPRLWEWVGKGSGMLIISRDGKIPEEATAEHLVSTYTGLAPWDSAYDILAVSDSDGSGFVDGEELNEFHFWVDGDEDGQIDKGETSPAGDVFTAIGTSPQTDAEGGRFMEAGAAVKGGGEVKTWEFWSRGQPWRKEAGRKAAVGLGKGEGARRVPQVAPLDPAGVSK